MESSKKHIQLQEISFPVFKLTTRKPLEFEGLLYYKAESINKDTAEYKSNIYIIDDKTIELPTLSRRRLELKTNGVKLYSINKAVYFLADLIKISKPGLWWIDSNGKVFEYKKTTKAKLRYYKIQNWFPVPGLGAVIQVEGIPQRFKTIFRPSATETWCAVLEFDRIKILYGFYDKKYPDTWRLV